MYVQMSYLYRQFKKVHQRFFYIFCTHTHTHTHRGMCGGEESQVPPQLRFSCLVTALSCRLRCHQSQSHHQPGSNSCSVIKKGFNFLCAEDLFVGTFKPPSRPPNQPPPTTPQSARLGFQLLNCMRTNQIPLTGGNYVTKEMEIEGRNGMIE